MLNKIKKFLLGILSKKSFNSIFTNYKNKFYKYSFVDCKCDSKEQLEASIIRLYHTMEKGLSYSDYRAGFGKDNNEMLLTSLGQYASKYGTDSFCYMTAMSCFNEYIRKNKEHGFEDPSIEERFSRLPGAANNCGGTLTVSKPNNQNAMNYETLVRERHSIRHFSSVPLDLELVKDAIRLAQYTPSACNRQGWKTRIVADKVKIKQILANQNGNRGFGQELDKLLIITADLRAQQRNRELFQAFIDGGMYAESVLNSLYFKGIGSVPLSASLTYKQEKNIRKISRINDAEVLIMFIGIGKYPDEEFLTTRSERKPADIEVL